MKIDIVLYAIPFFTMGLLLERALVWRKKLPLYEPEDTFTNLSLGIGSQILGALTFGVTYTAYRWVYHYCRLWDLNPDSAATFLFAFFSVDFLYYWYHRASHRVNMLWASHVVHHQSENFNLSVALRQPWFTLFTSWIFYLPLAVAGLPVEVFAFHSGLNLVLQFWFHTQLIDRMGPLEWVLNTPSHHRVHHATNDRYLDKNYAGVFIVWDRLFGTFEPETEKPVYGCLERFRSRNPIEANLYNWRGIFQEMRLIPSWRNRIALWIREPGWVPPSENPKVEPIALESAKT